MILINIHETHRHNNNMIYQEKKCNIIKIFDSTQMTSYRKVQKSGRKTQNRIYWTKEIIEESERETQRHTKQYSSSLE